MIELWSVWLVHYATYAELDALVAARDPRLEDGEIKPRLIVVRLSFEAAQKMVRELGFGYCMKPV